MRNITTQENLYTLNHPLVEHNLAVVRDVNYDPERYNSALRKILRLLMYEGSAFLPTVKKEITTPLCKTQVDVLDPELEIVLAPILRAGLVFSDIAQELLPTATVQHLGMYRDEDSLEPVWYYNKTLKKFQNPSNVHVFILDPMLATGNSAYDAIKCFTQKNVPEENIVFISLIASPQGVKKIHENFTKVKIFTSHLDKELNAKGYIVPGLGDAGDKAFNTLR